MAVVDHETGDVVYATSYDGPINDKAALPTVYSRMLNAGLRLENNILVTDRGFNSIYNTQLAINLEIKYLQFMQINQKATQQQLRRKKALLIDPVAARLPDFESLSACTVEDIWSQATDAGPIEVRPHLHLYRNHAIAEFETNKLFKDVNTALTAKRKQTNRLLSLQSEHTEQYRKLMEQGHNADEAVANLLTTFEKKRRAILSEHVVDDELWARVSPFLRSEKENKGVAAWAIDYDALTKTVEFYGCQAIRTNVTDMDASEAMRIYRQRQIIEQGFRQLKNEVGGARFETTEAAYRGKLFIYTLAESIRMTMLATASVNRRKTPSLKLPGDSLRKLLHSCAASKPENTAQPKPTCSVPLPSDIAIIFAFSE